MGFFWIRERRVENDGKTPRAKRRCWQCRPSRKEDATMAAAAAVASAVASRAGSNSRPAVAMASPARGSAAAPGSSPRMRIDPFDAAAGSTLIANHQSLADVFYIAWRYPATSVPTPAAHQPTHPCTVLREPRGITSTTASCQALCASAGARVPGRSFRTIDWDAPSDHPCGAAAC